MLRDAFGNAYYERNFGSDCFFYASGSEGRSASELAALRSWMRRQHIRHENCRSCCSCFSDSICDGSEHRSVEMCCPCFLGVGSSYHVRAWHKVRWSGTLRSCEKGLGTVFDCLLGMESSSAQCLICCVHMLYSRSLLSSETLIYDLGVLVDAQVLSGRCVTSSCCGVTPATGSPKSTRGAVLDSLHLCRGARDSKMLVTTRNGAIWDEL